MPEEVKDPAVSEAARLLRSRRRLVQITCAYCGKVFVGLTNKRTCSDSHRVMLTYRRHTAEQRERLKAYRRERRRQRAAVTAS